MLTEETGLPVTRQDREMPAAPSETFHQWYDRTGANPGPEFHDQAYCVFNTGPSATAGIEGVLIHGVQGVRPLTVVPATRGATV